MSTPRPAGRILADGAMRGLAAELLLLPTGLVTAAVLARVLGPVDYGRFSLASSIVSWLTVTTVALLGRAAIKFLSDVEDWRPVASTILRTRLVVGVTGAGVLLIGSGFLETIFGIPGLAPLLRVFAIDVLLVNLVRAYRETLTGTGNYRALAFISAVRWPARMVLLVALVLWQRSVMAAVVASVLTTAVELVIAIRLQPIPWRAAGAPSARRLWTVAAPLIVFGLAMQLHGRIDLFAVSALQRNTDDIARAIGWYGAAQNLAVAPSLFVMTVAPLLLATLGRLQRDGQGDQAKAVARDVLRVTQLLIPGVAIVFLCATELVTLIFGHDFGGAAALLGPLFAAGEASCILAVTISILIAAERPALVSWIGLLLLGSSVAGQLMLVPQFGAFGAAMVTLGSSVLAALTGLLAVYRVWGVHAVTTLARAVVVAGAVLVVGGQVTTTTWWGLTIKLIVLTILAGCSVVLLGELSAAERLRFLKRIAGRH